MAETSWGPVRGQLRGRDVGQTCAVRTSEWVVGVGLELFVVMWAGVGAKVGGMVVDRVVKSRADDVGDVEMAR